VAKKEPRWELDVGGTVVSVSSPSKVYWPKRGYTKRDLIEYYLAVMDGALRGARDRPVIMKRFVKGIAADPFFQKRAPKSPPDFVETAVLKFPSGRTAEEVVLANPATLIWCTQLGCVDINPHPTRKDDLFHPDELRVDLDPMPGVEWQQICDVALASKEVLDELGLVGFPKTSGSRGIHILVRIEREWDFKEVRRAALAIAREVERRHPDIATARWWKEERRGVFLDYNQNAKDRTVCSAYSVRPTEDARVSTPLTWDEVAGCDPGAFTLETVPQRFTDVGDPHEKIDDKAYSLAQALALADEQEASGEDDAPWPPHYPKQPGEGPRVQPSRAKKTKGKRTQKVETLDIAKAKHEDEALAGLERWKERHPEVANLLAEDDVLVDKMRGRYTTWTRVRVRLWNVPEDLRPKQEALEVDYDPRAEWEGDDPPA
jgi:DNA ligase D-like protein (predicted polymerase)